MKNRSEVFLPAFSPSHSRLFAFIRGSHPIPEKRINRQYTPMHTNESDQKENDPHSRSFAVGGMVAGPLRPAEFAPATEGGPTIDPPFFSSHSRLFAFIRGSHPIPEKRINRQSTPMHTNEESIH